MSDCPKCGGTGLLPGWVPSFSDPDNRNMVPESEPCDCKTAHSKLQQALDEMMGSVNHMVGIPVELVHTTTPMTCFKIRDRAEVYWKMVTEKVDVISKRLPMFDEGEDRDILHTFSLDCKMRAQRKMRKALGLPHVTRLEEKKRWNRKRRRK